MTPTENQEIRDQLNRIERCLVGDPAMGHKGLVHGHANHERRILKLERAMVYGAGAGFTLYALYSVAAKFLL